GRRRAGPLRGGGRRALRRPPPLRPRGAAAALGPGGARGGPDGDDRAAPASGPLAAGRVGGRGQRGGPGPRAGRELLARRAAGGGRLAPAPRPAGGAPGGVEGAADAAVAFDIETALPDGILAGLDAAAAGAGVEVEAPFLDPSLAALVVPPAARHKLGRAHG